MASIKVKLRPSTYIDREGSVYYQVIHDRVSRQIPTDYRVFPSEWNHQRATVTCAGTGPRRAYLLFVRERIKGDVARIMRIVGNFENSRLDFSADDIVDEYRRIVEEFSLFNYMESVIAKLKYSGKFRTSETYRAALNSFSSFRGGNDLLIEFVDNEVIEAYESWQRRRGISKNTISFYLRILRAVYNRAVEEGITRDRKPFRRVYTGVEKTVKRALPMNMIRSINRMDLSSKPKLEFARDIFILSFMLRGMSLIDMAFLKKTDLKDGYLTYRRRKTGQRLMIEWTPEMQAILDRHPNSSTEYLLPLIKNPRSIAFYAYRNAGYAVNRNLRAIGESLHLPVPLTMYVARHSWASSAKAKGIPISVISEGMGHDSESTTRIYLASLEAAIVDRANLRLIKELIRGM